MGYKFKPNKSVKKRLRMTANGKLKHGHSFHTHLMSSRPAKKRRKTRRAGLVFEGAARNMRKLMGVGGIHPGKIRHERELELKLEEKKTEEPKIEERK